MDNRCPSKQSTTQNLFSEPEDKRPGSPCSRYNFHFAWHTSGAIASAVVQPGDGGLQLQSPDGAWREAAPPPDALLVNLSNLMACWTNVCWQSTLHRVTNPPAGRAACSRRSSLAFFHKVNTDAVVEVLPSCMGEGEAPLFEPRRARELSRQGVLWRHRHLPPEAASAAYHAELAALRRAQESVRGGAG
jgi:isopenicillin N synthase-like dioxygenase